MPNEKTYLGKVVDIKDPIYQGRARIEVFGIFDGLPIEDLPWAEQISGLAFVEALEVEIYLSLD
jgi:hypothetical protein